MKTLLTVDLYVNAWFQMVLNRLRGFGIHTVWFLLVTHVSAVYFFLMCAASSAVANDLMGLILSCLVVTALGVFIVRVFYEAFLLLVGEGATVDALRLKFQEDVLNGRNTASRPACLLGACILIAVDPGVYPPMEPFSYGFLLLSTGFYLETCV